MSKTNRTYKCWRSMIVRCQPTTTDKFHKHYLRKGIKCCARWQVYENFLEDMGEQPIGLSLDRINNAGDYTPENCRWATREQQQNNRDNNIWLTFNGQTKTLSQWAKHLGFKYDTLNWRHRAGWSVEKILTQPVQVQRR